VSEPSWFTYDQAIAAHSAQLRRYGGAPGLRDEGALRSALDRPVNKWHYESADLPELAAAYAFGLAKNHAFVDGNKRIAFIARPGAIHGDHFRGCRRRGQRGKPRAVDSQ
jgi:death-on-curing protein